MPIPERNNQVWKRLLSGSLEMRFEFMALNLLVYNLKTRITKDPGEMEKAVDELRSFFETNQSLPKVQTAIAGLEKEL